MDKSSNNFVSLKGKLSRDPKVIEEHRKPFAVLSIGTRDSYVDEGGELQYRNTTWHNDCLAFDLEIVDQIRGLKKNDWVTAKGELSYRKSVTQEGYVKNYASIIITSLSTDQIS